MVIAYTNTNYYKVKEEQKVAQSMLKSVRDVPYKYYESVFQTGSTIICSPPVTNTDEDWMFYTKDMSNFQWYLMENGFKQGGSKGEQSYWSSWKKGKLNFLLTDDIDYYDKFETATKVATKLNLKDKSQRVTLFNYVMNGEV